MPWLIHNWLRALAHAGALLPLAWLTLAYLSNPHSFTFPRTFMLLTGSAGLILLVASLACSPLSRLLRWPRLTQVRRVLGLYAVLHVALHLGVYVVADGFMDYVLIWRDLGERPAMNVGLAAFLLLLPLAFTSTRGWQRRLGRRWKSLHRLVYLAAPLSVLHFLMLERDYLAEPVIYGVLVAGLLALRLPVFRAGRSARPEQPAAQSPESP